MIISERCMATPNFLLGFLIALGLAKICFAQSDKLFKNTSVLGGTILNEAKNDKRFLSVNCLNRSHIDKTTFRAVLQKILTTPTPLPPTYFLLESTWVSTAVTVVPQSGGTAIDSYLYFYKYLAKNVLTTR